MFQRILVNPLLTTFIVAILILVYHEGTGKKDRQSRRRKMRNKRERVDLTRLIVTEKKESGKGPELM